MHLYMCQNKQLDEPVHGIKPDQWLIITEDGDVYSPGKPEPVYTAGPDDAAFDPTSIRGVVTAQLLTGYDRRVHYYLTQPAYKAKLEEWLTHNQHGTINTTLVMDLFHVDRQHANQLIYQLCQQGRLEKYHTYYRVKR